MSAPPRSSSLPSHDDASVRLRLEAQHWPAAAREFRCAFTFRQGDRIERWWAMGADAEIRVHVDRQRLSFELMRHGQRRLAEHLRHPGRETPYRLMFEYLGEFRRRTHTLLARENISADAFLGGWQALMSPGSRAPIARFTVPRMWARSTDRHPPDTAFASSRFGVVRSTPAPRADAPLAAAIISQIPEKEPYVRGLARLLEDLNHGEHRKVVVARKVRARLSRPLDPLELLQRMEARGLSEVYSYMFQWDAGDAWVGVSPEPLLIMRGANYETRVLAGTCKPKPAGGNLDELLADAKEDREHQAAVDLMLRDLESVSRPGSLRCHRKEITQLKYAAHLKTEIAGTAGADVDACDILGSIYPPATIWGVPRDWSGTRIAQLEPFQREYYTGGLGYMTSAGEANFALPIRTAVLRGDLLDLFAGSGIVAGAQPHLEWEETTTKLWPFLSLLNGGGGGA